MVNSNLKGVEKKVLGALLILSDKDMVVTAPLKLIANTMGYKATGGALTFALQALEMKNFIATSDSSFKVLL